MAVFSQPDCKRLWPNLCLTEVYPLENDLILTRVFKERQSPVLSQSHALLQLCFSGLLQILASAFLFFSL